MFDLDLPTRVPLNPLFPLSCVSDFLSGINFFLLESHSSEFLLVRFQWWKTLFLLKWKYNHFICWKILVPLSTFSFSTALTSGLGFCWWEVSCQSNCHFFEGNLSLSFCLLLSHFSRVQLCATPLTAAHQAPLSLGFSRQEHWSGLPFPFQCMKVKSESDVAQSSPTPSDPMDCSPPAPLSMGFARQEYWSGLPLPSPLLCLKLLIYEPLFTREASLWP